MKNIVVHKKLSDYRNYIKKHIIQNNEFYESRFYSGLIDFIVDNRTPIFFEASQSYEYAHFTQYFNWVLVRQGYTNSYLSDLYFIHDFVHMIFYNPLNPKSHSLSDFRDIVVANERIAANETEIFTYYRLPSLRPLTFDSPILFDFLKKRFKDMPDSLEIYKLRNSLIQDNKIPAFLDHQDGKRIITFLKRFKDNNKLWTQRWWESFPQNSCNYLNAQIHLPLTNYQEFLYSYRSHITQKSYEENILRNIILGLEILGVSKKPKTFSEVFDYLHFFENKVFLEDLAEEYHQAYISAKRG